MRLDQYLDVEKLTQYIAEGIVDERKHPTLPLTILCYSRRATYEDIWDDITTKCRGLIVSDSGHIVSRAFEKFFNLDTFNRPETHFRNLPKELPHTFEKLDGSLGILYEYPISDDITAEPYSGVASKGSFTSDHANWATTWYRKHCKNPQWPKGYTPVFEMICQSVQRHVVYYDIPDQLVLLALIDKETGEELDYNMVYHYAFLNGLKTVDIFQKKVSDVLIEDRDNKEGYVLSWPQKGKAPLKVKVKHETFLKLQKIVHAATPKSILEALTDRQFNLIDTWKASASPELAEFVEVWSNRLCANYGDTLAKCKSIVDTAKLRFPEDRKAIADYFMHPERKKYSKVCFTMLDGKDFSRAGWALVKEHYKDELTRPVMGDPDDDQDEVERHDGNPDSYHPSKEAACQ